MELSHPAMWHVALGSWQWIHQVAAPCNVIRGSRITAIEFARWQHTAMWHIALESRQCIRQVVAPCNVAGGSGMTCHWIRPNVRHTGILHLVSILTISPQSTCYSAPFCMGKNRPKSENWATLTPRSSATVHRTEKSTGSAKLPGPWTTMWSKLYLCSASRDL